MENQKKPLILSKLFFPMMIFVIFGFFVFSSALSYFKLSRANFEDMAKRAQKAAEIIAISIDGEKLDSLKNFNDTKTEEYKDIMNYVRNVLAVDSQITNVYALRRTDSKDTLSFIIDSTESTGRNIDGTITDVPGAFIGETYDTNQSPRMMDGLNTSTHEDVVTHDKWGDWISGYTPIKDSTGKTVAVLGVDITAKHYYEFQNLLIRAETTSGMFFFICTILFAMIFNYRHAKLRDYISITIGEANSIIEYSPIGIYSLLPDGTIDSFNPKMVELSGDKSAKDIIGVNAFELESYKKSGLDKYFRQGLAGKPFEVETPYTSQLGNKTTFRKYIGTPIFHTNTKKVAKLLLIVQDVTQQKNLENQIKYYSKELETEIMKKTSKLRSIIAEQKKTEKAMLNILDDYRMSEENLKKERDRANAVVSSMDEGLILTDQSNKIVLLNQAGGAILRTVPQEANGKTVANFIKLFDSTGVQQNFKRLLNKVVADGEIVRIGLEDGIFCAKTNNVHFPISIVLSPFRSDGITGAVITFRDITPQKELDEAKNSFISVASHQLRTPLTSIRWYAEMLMHGGMKKMSEKEKKYADHIYTGTLRLNETINLLLSISRIESGKREVDKEYLHFTDCLNGTLTQLKAQLDQKGIKIITTIDKNIPTYYGSRTQVDQVLLNLLSNAIRYSPTGEAIEISAKRFNDGVIISIKDHGIGIPKNEHDKIFDKFYRASNAIKAVPDGSGLGLSLVKALVEAWGGKVEFESKEGSGSSFSFTIPSKK